MFYSDFLFAAMNTFFVLVKLHSFPLKLFNKQEVIKKLFLKLQPGPPGPKNLCFFKLFIEMLQRQAFGNFVYSQSKESSWQLQRQLFLLCLLIARSSM